MTKEQIDTMPAGRELDTLVAEKVMGWGWRTLWIEGKARNSFLVPPGWDATANVDADPPVEVREGCESENRAQSLRRYSTDIAAAWEVVEHMARDGWTLDLQWKGADRTYALTAELTFSKWIGDEPVHAHAYADTVPLAIARAALHAALTP